MTATNRVGSYYYSYSGRDNTCSGGEFLTEANVVVDRHIGRGEDGQTRGMPPKINNYNLSAKSEDLGNIEVTWKRRSYSSVPCGGSILDPITLTCKKTVDWSHPTTSSISDDVRRTTYTTFLSKVYQKQRTAQSGVMLGELGQTLRMFRSPLAGIVKLTTKLARKNRKILSRRPGRVGRSQSALPSARETGAALNDAYLEYQFGLKPFLSDVKSLAEVYYRQKTDVYNFIIPVRKRGKSSAPTASSPYSWSMATSSGSIGGDGSMIETCDSTIQYLAYLTCGASCYGASPLRTDLGLDFGSFIPTVYNLIPWSFVADYFSNLGEFLEAQVVVGSSSGTVICETICSRAKLRIVPSISMVNPPNWDDPFYTGPFDVVASITPAEFRSMTMSRSRGTINSMDHLRSFKLDLPSIHQLGNLTSLGATFTDLYQDRSKLTSKQRKLFGIP